MQKFCKGGLGKANLGYLKKRGAQLQATSGGTLKISSGILRGSEIDTRGRMSLPPPPP